jgi:hypothetical protein
MTRQIKSIIIHCSATPDGKWVMAGEIDLWHKDRGFKRADEFRQRQNPTLAAIGYHFVILVNGTVATGRHLDEAGAHAPGFDSKSIGICLIGTGKFTAAQWLSLRQNVLGLQEHVMLIQADKAPVRVLGHRDLTGAGTPCPGFSVSDWVKNDMRPLSAHLLDESRIADAE